MFEADDRRRVLVCEDHALFRRAVVTSLEDADFEVVAEAVGKGEKVTVPGWISFEQTQRAARQGRNPATGEAMQIPATKAAKVSAGSKLKAAAKG